MKSVCVFCGANFNGDPVVKQVVEQLAQVMVARNIRLVFGGGKIGLMGVLADAVLQSSGEAIGVIPKFLLDKEIAHNGLTELHIVESMHQRKQMMNGLCDGMIMMPGGFGTLEEFFEMLTWLQLGLHHKPVGVLNINGFYNCLLKQMDVMVEQQYLKHANRQLVITSGDPIELINLMAGFHVQTDDGWFKDSNLT